MPVRTLGLIEFALLSGVLILDPYRYFRNIILIFGRIRNLTQYGDAVILCKYGLIADALCFGDMLIATQDNEYYD